MKKYFKNSMAVLMIVVLLFVNTFIFVEAETTEQAMESTQTKTLYRYRTKKYTTNKGSYYSDWVVYKTESIKELYKSFRNVIPSDINGQDLSYWKSVYPAPGFLVELERIDMNGQSGYVYNTRKDGTGSNVYTLYWAGYQNASHTIGTECYVGGRTVYYRGRVSQLYDLNIYFVKKYYLYKWNDWSRWDVTPVTADDDTEVETKVSDVFETGSCGNNLTWKLDVNGRLTIEGSGDMDDWTTTNLPWRSYASSIESVEIGQYVNNIGDYAFYNCQSLKEVTFADYSIKTIGSNAFMNCSAIEDITLPKGLATIDNKAFENCTSLAEIVIPQSVTSIENDALSLPEKTTIYGITGSFAEDFAKEGGFEFVDNSVPLEGIVLKGDSDYITIEKGATYRAEFEIYPEDATDIIYMTANNENVIIDGHDISACNVGETVINVITASGVPYEFYINIRAAESISVISLPTKTEYIVGEEFDADGLVVQANYSDGFVKTVEDYEVKGFDSSAEGVNTVTVEWTDLNGSIFTANFNLTINPLPHLTGITVGNLPNKTFYLQRESLDLTGLIISGIYSDGSTKPIADYTVSGYNALRKGTQTITVKHEDFTTTFNVIVNDHKPGCINSDEEVNLKDLVIISQYVSGWENLTVNDLALDVNGDSSVDLEDVNHLARYLAGWNVVLN